MGMIWVIKWGKREQEGKESRNKSSVRYETEDLNVLSFVHFLIGPDSFVVNHKKHLAFYLITDECWIIFEARSPFPVGLRILDSQNATAAVYDSPLYVRNDILNQTWIWVADYISEEVKKKKNHT